MIDDSHLCENILEDPSQPCTPEEARTYNRSNDEVVLDEVI